MRKILLWLLGVDMALWFGAGVYFALMAAEELSTHLSLNDFARAVGILFPPLFTLMAVTALIGWGLYWWYGASGHIHSRSFRLGHIAFLIGVLAALTDRLAMLPLVESVERQMGSFATASGAMLTRFGLVHGISLLIHFLEMLMALIVWLCLSLNLQSEGEMNPHENL